MTRIIAVVSVDNRREGCDRERSVKEGKKRRMRGSVRTREATQGICFLRKNFTIGHDP